MVAIFYAVSAAKPTEFDYAGNNPKRWARVAGQDGNMTRAMAIQASYYSGGIEGNGEILRTATRSIKKALQWVLIGIVAGSGAELIVVLSLIARDGFGVFLRL